MRFLFFLPLLLFLFGCATGQGGHRGYIISHSAIEEIPVDDD